MNKFDITREIRKEVVKLYDEECRKHLKGVAQTQITKCFKEILDNNKNDYNLSYTNTVYEGQYYEIKSRIKSKESIEEKFIRKSDILTIISKFNLTTIDDVTQKKEDILRFLYTYDDTIGIKIVTEVGYDSENVYKLINDNQDVFNHKGIQFYDLEQQPKKMKNGLKIFNIKAVFNNSYNFELQIKSRIESAWGDMDHAMFYKNYEFIPVKKSIQDTMNRVGNLLHEIDGLLFSIRNAGTNYKSDESKIKVLEQVYSYYQHNIKELLKIEFDFNFNKYQNLIHAYSQMLLEGEEVPNIDLQSGFLDYDIASDDKLIQNYMINRNNNYDIFVIEIIYINWLTHRGKYDDCQGNYESVLKIFLENYINFIIEEFDFISEDNTISKNVINSILENTNVCDSFLASATYQSISRYNRLLKDAFFGFETNDIDNPAKQNQLEVLLKIFSLRIFDNRLYFIDECIDLFDYEMERIEKIFDKINNDINTMKDINYDNYQDHKSFIQLNQEIINEIKRCSED